MMTCKRRGARLPFQVLLSSAAIRCQVAVPAYPLALFTIPAFTRAQPRLFRQAVTCLSALCLLQCITTARRVCTECPQRWRQGVITGSKLSAAMSNEPPKTAHALPPPPAIRLSISPHMGPSLMRLPIWDAICWRPPGLPPPTQRQLINLLFGKVSLFACCDWTASANQEH